MKLLNKVSFNEVVNSKSEIVYYSTRTFWWTDDPEDLHKTKPLPSNLIPAGSSAGFGSGLPCDVFGCVLYQIEKKKWVGDVTKIINHYGSIDILMAMHAKNFIPDTGDPIKMFAEKQTFIDALNSK